MIQYTEFSYDSCIYHVGFAKGLNSDVMLIPKERLSAVLAVLEGFDGPDFKPNSQKNLSDDLWQA